LTQWKWNFGDGTPVVTNISNAPVNHIFANWGTYNVTLTVTTNNNCKSIPNVIPVTIHPLPRPSFTFETSLCIPNALAHFNNISSIADGTIGTVTYLWNFGDGSPAQSLAAPAHLYTATGPFNVRLEATSINNCRHDTTIVLNIIHPQPKAAFNMDKPSSCLGEPVQFSSNSNGMGGAVNQWFWNFGDGQTATGTPVVSHVFPDSITYTINLYIINSFGCNSDTVNKPFTVYPYPKVNAGPDKFVLEGGIVALTPDVFGRLPQYLWTPNLYLQNNQNTILAPVVNGVADITYTLTVTGDGGCSASDKVFVKVLKFPVIPNTFTPNADGINDHWDITYLSSYPDNHVQVFTRTGQLVFESRGYARPWDGSYKGKLLPTDTYYYIIEPGSGRKPVSGYVTIVK
jgi:gliding motility-associated-like protein